MNASEVPGCERVCARLEELRDGGLGPLETARDEGHLEACPRCQVERVRAEQVAVLVRAAARASADELAYARAGLATRLARTGVDAPASALARAARAALALAAGLALMGLVQASALGRGGVGGIVGGAGELVRQGPRALAGVGEALDRVLGGGRAR